MVQEFGRRRQYQQIEDEMAAFYEETQNKQVVVEEELMKNHSLVALRQDRRWHRSAIPSKVEKPAFRKSCQPPTVDCEFCERLVVKHTTDDLQWLWTHYSVLEEGAAKARLAGVKAGEERLRSG